WSRKSSEGRGFESHRNHQECSLSRLHIFILGGYGILPYPRSPLMIAVAFLGGYGIPAIPTQP
ncbi:hypothetical protein, partial [Leyella stercorea]|uniref:hypothetical protein n=1 Tax=Leyella stercorea TaxID=363265 RepID=UPI003F804A86